MALNLCTGKLELPVSPQLALKRQKCMKTFRCRALGNAGETGRTQA